jgi:hypothetical protein
MAIATRKHHLILSPFIDSSFVAVLYTSDSDKMMRYTDEGETAELCKWTVDLSSLPTFQQNAAMPQPGGFYTGENAERFRKGRLRFCQNLSSD